MFSLSANFSCRTNVLKRSKGFEKTSICSVRLQNLCWGHIYGCLQSAPRRLQEHCDSCGVKVSNGQTSGGNVTHSCRWSWHLFAVKFISRHWDMCVRHASHIQGVFAKLWGGCWGHGDLHQPRPKPGGPRAAAAVRVGWVVLVVLWGGQRKKASYHILTSPELQVRPGDS